MFVLHQGFKQHFTVLGECITVDNINLPLDTIAIFSGLFFPTKNKQINVTKCHFVTLITEHNKGKKIQVLKFKRRKNYKKQYGHRQKNTIIKILAILQIS